MKLIFTILLFITYTCCGQSMSVLQKGETLSFAQTIGITQHSKMSYEMWFRLHSVEGGHKILFKIMDKGEKNGVMMRLDGTEHMGFFIKADSKLFQTKVQSRLYLSDPKFIAQRWYHLIFTSTGNCYVDGQRVNNDILTNQLSGTSKVFTSPLVIGGPVGMDVSTTRIFSKILSASEAKKLYNNGEPLLNAKIDGQVFELFGSKADMNMNMRAGRQYFKGNSINYNTYGLSGESEETSVSDSPFTDVRRAIYYDSATNRTYITWHQRPFLGGNRQGMVMYIDHTRRYCSPSYPLGYLSPGGYDTHGQPSIIKDARGEFLIFQENLHNSPIYVKKTTGNLKNIRQISVIEGSNGYPAPIRIGNDIYVLTRSGPPESNGYMHDYISKSSDNGVTWTRNKIINTYNSTGIDRAYFDIVWHPTKLVVLQRVRDDTKGKYYDVHYWESLDGVTLSNVDNSFSKNTTTGPVTRKDLFDHYNVRKSVGEVEDVLIKGSIALDKGLVGWGNKGTDKYVTIWWDGTWKEKPLNLPNFIPVASVGNATRGDRWHGHKISDTHYLLWRLEKRNGFDVVVQYETFDFFDTFDAGTVISPANMDHQQLVSTWNRVGNKIVLAANQLTRKNGNTNMWIYEYTPNK